MASLRFALLVSILALLNVNASKAQWAVKALETKNGFRDAKLGMPLSAFKDMTLTNRKDPLGYANRTYALERI